MLHAEKVYVFPHCEERVPFVKGDCGQSLITLKSFT